MALERLERNSDEAAEMSRDALEKAKRFTLDNFTDKLISGVEVVRFEKKTREKKPGN